MASGDTLIFWTALAGEPPSSNPAGFDTRNQHPILTFDDTTSENMDLTAVMPQAYAAGGVTVYLYYSMASATSGDVDLDVAFERIGDQVQDVDADGFAAVNSVDGTTVPGTAGLVDVVNIAFTNGADMDSVVAGDLFRIRVTRDIADTATGDLELHAVEIRET
jgi:hypothetical protein